jgi:hypothetical protein
VKKSRGRHPGASRDPLLHHIELSSNGNIFEGPHRELMGPGFPRVVKRIQRQ